MLYPRVESDLSSSLRPSWNHRAKISLQRILLPRMPSKWLLFPNEKLWTLSKILLRKMQKNKKTSYPTLYHLCLMNLLFMFGLLRQVISLLCLQFCCPSKSSKILQKPVPKNWCIESSWSISNHQSRNRALIKL